MRWTGSYNGIYCIVFQILFEESNRRFYPKFSGIGYKKVTVITSYSIHYTKLYDIDLFARIALKFHITLVPKVLHNAIIHSAERISTNHRKKLDGYIRFYQKHNGYMSDSGKCYLFDRIVFHAFWLNEKSIANKYHILRCEIQNPSIKYSIFYMGTRITSYNVCYTKLLRPLLTQPPC